MLTVRHAEATYNVLPIKESILCCDKLQMLAKVIIHVLLWWITAATFVSAAPIYSGKRLFTERS